MPDIGGSDCSAEQWEVDGECIDLNYRSNLADAIEKVDSPPATPPNGTTFFSPDIITENDPSSFDTLIANGQDTRTMFDRRTASFESFDAHLFDATFSNGKVVEVQVNPEFNAQEAR